MAVAAFKTSLANTITACGLQESNWSNSAWQDPWKKINQDVLNDAWTQHAKIQELFSDLGKIVPRSAKVMDRVSKKMTEQPLGRENYFKVISDFAAVRVPCEVTEIAKKIECIKAIVLQKGGQVYVRGESPECPYGFCIAEDGIYQDITQYVYVYLQEIGYVLEMQIGHPFAAHTFTIDSKLRDDPECGFVDLWTNGFYMLVKRYILDKANGHPVNDSFMSRSKEIHPNGVPKELQEILNAL